MAAPKHHWASLSETHSWLRRRQQAVVRRMHRLLPQDPRSALGRQMWRNAWPPDGVMEFPTMLMNDERRLLYWLARTYYTGAGAIIDGGTFLGGAFFAMAAGLRDRRLREDIRPILCYDTFIADEYMLAIFPNELRGVHPGDSLLDHFSRLTRDFAEYRDPRVGDMAGADWEGGPIEILMLDVLKSWHTNDNVTERFYPSLLPGRGVIIHQDYIHEWCPWIHITMELLREYVTLADVAATSAVFLVTKQIPYEAAKRCRREHVTPADQSALLARAVARFKGTRRGVLECCQARLRELQGDRAGAEALLQDIQRRYSSDEHVCWCAGAVLRFLSGGDAYAKA